MIQITFGFIVGVSAQHLSLVGNVNFVIDRLTVSFQIYISEKNFLKLFHDSMEELIIW